MPNYILSFYEDDVILFTSLMLGIFLDVSMRQPRFTHQQNNLYLSITSVDHNQPIKSSQWKWAKKFNSLIEEEGGSGIFVAPL